MIVGIAENIFLYRGYVKMMFGNIPYRISPQFVTINWR